MRSEAEFEAGHDGGFRHREAVVDLVAGGGQVLPFGEECQGSAEGEGVGGAGVQQGVVLGGLLSVEGPISR